MLRRILKKYSLPIHIEDLEDFEEIDYKEQIQLYDAKGNKTEWETETNIPDHTGIK